MLSGENFLQPEKQPGQPELKQAVIGKDEIAAMKKIKRVFIPEFRGQYGKLFFDNDCTAVMVEGAEQDVKELQDTFDRKGRVVVKLLED